MSPFGVGNHPRFFHCTFVEPAWVAYTYDMKEVQLKVLVFMSPINILDKLIEIIKISIILLIAIPVIVVGFIFWTTVGIIAIIQKRV